MNAKMKTFQPPSIDVWGTVSDLTRVGCSQLGEDIRDGSNHPMNGGGSDEGKLCSELPKFN